MLQYNKSMKDKYKIILSHYTLKSKTSPISGKNGKTATGQKAKLPRPVANVIKLRARIKRFSPLTQLFL